MVVSVKRLHGLPFDTAGKQNPGGGALTVGTDQIDLGIVLPVPPSTDSLDLRPAELRSDTQQRLPDHRFDRTATPGRPGTPYPAQQQVGTSTLDQGQPRFDERQKETQVRVGHPITPVLISGFDRQRSIDSDHPFGFK